MDESEDHDYDLDLDTYQPVQSLSNDHGVSFFPISAPHSGIDHHVLQVKKIKCSILIGFLYLCSKKGGVKMYDIFYNQNHFTVKTFCFSKEKDTMYVLYF